MMNYVVTQTAFTRLLTRIFKQNNHHSEIILWIFLRVVVTKQVSWLSRKIEEFWKSARGNEFQCRGKRIISRRRKPTSWQFGCWVSFSVGAYGRSQKNWGSGAPFPWDRDRSWPYWNTLLPTRVAVPNLAGLKQTIWTKESLVVKFTMRMRATKWYKIAAYL